jgi:flavin-dependent thymidylate synthase
MKVTLAGYNIESEMIDKAETALGTELTPEVISAAYARISRDPRSVGSLRREAREAVGKARRSNETIIFGLGHSSVAEHAAFNFDVTGVSRLAVESIEHFRLVSFTEKSQRYIRLGRDRIIPQEVKDIRAAERFSAMVRRHAVSYEKLYEKIMASGHDKWTAREDARYLMPLATTAQFGMTLNARELEYMISRLASEDLKELRAFSRRLASIAARKAPSLVKYPEPTPYFRSMAEIPVMAAKAAGCHAKKGFRQASLLEVTSEADRKLCAAIIFSGSSCSYDKALEIAKGLESARVKEIIASTMKQMTDHDPVMREFENIDLLYEVDVSASCYAQLKRHRMSTQMVQRYSTHLGVTVPESVKKSGAEKIFMKAIDDSEKMYREFVEKIGRRAAEYALTNAHRRRVLLKINLRELYHFSRLRSDIHAQWEIRSVSDKMCRLAEEKIPVGSMLLCGKDSFEKRKTEKFDQ